MPDEPKPPGPDYIATKPIPRVDPIVELTKVVREGFAASDANDTLILGQMQSLSVRVGAIEGRVSSLEEAKSKHSGGIRELSSHDHSQEAALAKIIVEQQELEKKVTAWNAFLGRVDAVVQDPKARAVFWLIVAGLLAKIGINLK